MTSYFNACDVTVAYSNHKIFYNFFSTCTCAPHFEKGSPTHGHKRNIHCENSRVAHGIDSTTSRAAILYQSRDPLPVPQTVGESTERFSRYSNTFTFCSGTAFT